MSFSWADNAGAKQLANAVKQVYKGQDLWRVLLDESCAESGPFDGGCLICAQAIIQANGSGELMRIVNGDVTPNTTDHYGARINGVIWDFNGTYATPKAWIKKFESLENLKDRQRFVDIGKDARSKIPEDAAATAKIASLIADAIQSNSHNQTNTPAFKKWFGASKVIDSESEPLVVYHGTKSDFRKFNIGREGIFFSESPDTAGFYAKGCGANIIPVYLSIERPLKMTWREWFRGITDDGMNHYMEGNDGLALRGYDGVMLTEPDERDPATSSVTYIAFDPNQIKFFIGNGFSHLENSASASAAPTASMDVSKSKKSAQSSVPLTDREAALAIACAHKAKAHLQGLIVCDEDSISISTPTSAAKRFRS